MAQHLETTRKTTTFENKMAHQLDDWMDYHMDYQMNHQLGIPKGIANFGTQTTH